MSDNDALNLNDLGGKSLPFVILHELGVLKGTLDGVAKTVVDIQADNLRSEADRENTKREISHLQNKQYWFAGLAAGTGFALSKIATLFNVLPSSH